MSHAVVGRCKRSCCRSWSARAGGDAPAAGTWKVTWPCLLPASEIHERARTHPRPDVDRQEQRVVGPPPLLESRSPAV